jgi:hypothetical protein
MGFRFHRSIRLFPGVRLNLSKSGVSTSIGRPGAWFTFGPRGTRTTVGLPGTGLSYTATSSSHPHQEEQLEHQVAAEAPQPAKSSAGGWIVLLVLLAIAAFVGWLVGVAMRS